MDLHQQEHELCGWQEYLGKIKLTPRLHLSTLPHANLF